MSVEKVRKYLSQFNLESRIQEFQTSSATVELAASALGVESARIAKTLSFKIKKDDKEKCILIVCAGDKRIDNKKFKLRFNSKAKMLAPDEVTNYTGFKIGGVCPFGIENQDIEIYCDISLKRFKTIFPACGSSNSAIELTNEELFECSKSADWVDVCL